MNAPSLNINHAYLKYQGHVLFDNLNLMLKAGKFTCLLGPSGVGKSTLLRFIAQLISNETQTNLICKGKITSAPALELKNHIAYLGQENTLLPWLNAKDNALIGFKLRGKLISPDIEANANLLFKKLGLEKAKKLFPHQLSGGMRQRVALIRTFIENRSVILMDEPFSALDAITRFELQTLTALLLKNKTVLFVTHDPSEACRLADEIYILEGKPAQIRLALDLPVGTTPRDSLNPQLLECQKVLYKALLNAKEQTE